MSTRTETVITAALEVLKSNSDGVRYSDLVREIHAKLPEIPVNTINGTIWNLDARLPNEVYKPNRGLFRLVAFQEQMTEQEVHQLPEVVKKTKEEDFYKPFAAWLLAMDECTKAIALGANRFADKWGTPDVIGKRAPRASDIIKAPVEIVSAEVKADTKELITAFGQACSYKLFSHKSYVVVPNNSPESDRSRLDALCQIFGIGLVLFDPSNADDPQFEVRVRPLRHEPDMFYMNKYMRLIERELFG